MKKSLLKESLITIRRAFVGPEREATRRLLKYGCINGGWINEDVLNMGCARNNEEDVK